MRGQVGQQVLHRGEDIHVVGDGRQHDGAAAEGLADQLADMRLGHVVDAHVAHAALGQAGGDDVRGVLRAAVDGAVDHHHALLVLRLVAAPLVVLVDNPAQVLTPDRAVQRADRLNVDGRGLGQHRLHLAAVLAHDVAVIAAGVGEPLRLKVHLVGEEVAVQRAERAEGVGGEEHLVRGVVGHHDLGPVHHRRHHEDELVAAGGQLHALLDGIAVLLGIKAEELLDDLRRSRGIDQLGLRIAHHHLADGGAVIRLHVVDDKVVELAPVERVGEILKELAGHGAVHRIKEHGLLVQQQIGVVRDAAWNRVHVLKQLNPSVARAEIHQIVVNVAHIVHAGELPAAVKRVLLRLCRGHTAHHAISGHAGRAGRCRLEKAPSRHALIHVCTSQCNILFQLVYSITLSGPCKYRA